MEFCTPPDGLLDSDGYSSFEDDVSTGERDICACEHAIQHMGCIIGSNRVPQRLAAPILDADPCLVGRLCYHGLHHRPWDTWAPCASLLDLQARLFRATRHVVPARLFQVANPTNILQSQ